MANNKKDKPKALISVNHTVAENRRARYEYFLEEKFEAGIVLTGTEVKSLRHGQCSLSEAFAGDKRKFNKAVLASVLGPDVWVIGFVTDEELAKFELGADKVSVYVPQGYNFAGQLYILPREKVKMINKVSSGDAMKYAVTGGVVDPEGTE